VLTVESISKKIDGDVILSDFSVSVTPGERLAIVGPSGSGKTTILKCIAGLLVTDSGKITSGKQVFNDSDVFLPPWERKIGMVFQDLALWPHLSVKQHIDYVLKWIKYNKDRRKERLNYLLTLFEIEQFKMRYPHQLSGGQQQRLALVRLMASEPKIALLDEAFNQLDSTLSDKIWEILMDLQSESTLTIIFTSHEQDTINRYSTKTVNLTNSNPDS